MNKILSNVVIHKDYSKDIVRVLRSSKSDELIRRKLSKYQMQLSFWTKIQE